MTRRGLLLSLLAGSIGSAWKGKGAAAQLSSMKEVETLQKNWQALLAAGVTVPLPSQPLKLSKEEWRKRLQPDQFNILREEGTEPPGSSPLNNEKRPGVFTCAGCGLPVFTSDMKYESGTGWPSFFTAIPAASKPARISNLFCRAPSIIARAAAATMATSSTTARSRRENAGATTASRSSLSPRWAKPDIRFFYIL